MIKRLLFLSVFAMTAFHLRAQDAPDASELTRLLKEFLDGASRNDPAAHQRFWAEDLIYTRSAGKRIGKADILRDLKTPNPAEPVTIYTAEDIRIQQYGMTAIVAFRLVGTTKKGDETKVANFLNTGTFLKRDGKWQAVAWQATKMPPAEDESRKEIATAANKFLNALTSNDRKTIESLADKTFVFTDSVGNRMGPTNFIEVAKRSKPERTNETITIYGGAAIVRTKSLTLTFAKMDDDWKAVAMQMARRTD